MIKNSPQNLTSLARFLAGAESGDMLRCFPLPKRGKQSRSKGQHLREGGVVMQKARCVNLSQLVMVLSFLVVGFASPRPLWAQGAGEPTIEELGLRLAQYYINKFGGKLKLAGLSQAEIS